MISRDPEWKIILLNINNYILVYKPLTIYNAYMPMMVNIPRPAHTYHTPRGLSGHIRACIRTVFAMRAAKTYMIMRDCVCAYLSRARFAQLLQICFVYASRMVGAHVRCSSCVHRCPQRTHTHAYVASLGHK